MKNINFKLSDGLFNKLSDLRHSLSKLEKVSVSFSDMIEESLLGFYNIKLSDIKLDNDDIIDAVIVENNDNEIVINRSGDFFVYMYINKRKPINTVIRDIYIEYEPFYVGIGEKTTVIDTPITATQKIIDELKKTGDFETVVIMRDIDKLTAFRFQQALIYIFGRLNNGTGCLYNKNESEINAIGKDYVDDMINTYRRAGYTVKTIAEKMNISDRTVYRKIKRQ